jgi:hypothetical protein
MKKNSNSAIQKLIKKFDNQLLDILSADIRSLKYSKTKLMNQIIITG